MKGIVLAISYMLLAAVASADQPRRDVDGKWLYVFQGKDGYQHTEGYWDDHGIWQQGRIGTYQRPISGYGVKTFRPVPVQYLTRP